MAKIRDLPLGTYPNGAVDFGPRACPNGLAGFDVRIGRCTSADPTIWPNLTTIVTIDMQFSYDGGTTYTPLGGNSWSQGGGILLDKLGAEVAESVLTWRFEPNEPTHFKGRISVLNGPIKSYLDVTVL